ncbi:hypothetical protein TNCV_1836091 [Trichonephila clavipes]|nr:hypothetical protein TNCV_1836091 [Trichonephila clavipes]
MASNLAEGYLPAWLLYGMERFEINIYKIVASKDILKSLALMRKYAPSVNFYLVDSIYTRASATELGIPVKYGVGPPLTLITGATRREID